MFGCTKENVHEETPADVDGSAVAFTLFAGTSETRTAMNEGLNGVVWSADDQINVCHVISGDTTAFVNDTPYNSTSKTGAPFVISDVSSNKFLGTLAQALTPGSSYDWYAYYPYSSYIETPGYQSKGYLYFGSKSNASQTQTGNNSKAHLCGKDMPLYGVAKAVPADQTPSIVMNQLSSVVAVKVTNNTDSPLTVNSVSFTGTENIVGVFYPDIVGEKPVFFDGKYVANTANLSVEDATAIPVGGTAVYYIAIKPFDAKSGKSLYVSVNGYEKEIKLTKQVSFSSGKIKNINFAYDLKPYSYNRITSLSELTSGEYVILGEQTLTSFGLLSYSSPDNSKRLAYTKKYSSESDIPSSILPSDVSGLDIWTLSVSDGKVTLCSKSSKTYLIANTGLSFGSEGSEFTPSISEGMFALSVTNTGTDGTDKTTYFGVNKSSNYWRDYTEGTLTSTAGLLLYKKGDIDPRTALDAPEVTVVDDEIEWTPVANAGSYSVYIGGECIEGLSTTSITVDTETYSVLSSLNNGYYDVSVVAIPSDTDNYRNSPAGKGDARARVGSIVLQQPVLTVSSVTASTVSITWNTDSNATEGYYCSIYPSDAGAQTVTTGSVTFSDLSGSTEYTISVYAKQVIGDEPWTQSETGVITATTTGAGSTTYTHIFNSDTMQKGVSSYTASWQNESGGIITTLTNFNNNNKGWSSVKSGNKTSASVGTIVTNSSISEAMSKVVVTVDACTVASINSTKLYVATDSGFSENLQTIKLDAAKGEMVYTIPTPTANCYYKLEYDCAKGSSNGLITISKIVFTNAN